MRYCYIVLTGSSASIEEVFGSLKNAGRYCRKEYDVNAPSRYIRAKIRLDGEITFMVYNCPSVTILKQEIKQ